MKKILTVLCALVLIFAVMAPNAYSQGKGVLAGLNLANVYGDDAEQEGLEPSNRMGFTAGGFLTFGLSDNLAFRPEVLYGQHGAKYEQGGNEMTMKIASIDIPLLFQYTLSTDGNIKPFILAGPYAAYVLSAEMEFDIQGFTGDVDMKDDVKDIDFGVIVGIGAVFSDRFEISARYQMGLQTMDDSDEEGDIKNKTIQVIGGIHF